MTHELSNLRSKSRWVLCLPEILKVSKVLQNFKIIVSMISGPKRSKCIIFIDLEFTYWSIWAITIEDSKYRGDRSSISYKFLHTFTILAIIGQNLTSNLWILSCSNYLNISISLSVINISGNLCLLSSVNWNSRDSFFKLLELWINLSKKAKIVSRWAKSEVMTKQSCLRFYNETESYLKSMNCVIWSCFKLKERESWARSNETKLFKASTLITEGALSI